MNRHLDTLLIIMNIILYNTYEQTSGYIADKFLILTTQYLVYKYFEATLSILISLHLSFLLSVQALIGWKDIHVNSASVQALIGWEDIHVNSASVQALIG